MKVQPKTSRATAKGQSKTDRTGCSVGSHEALSQTGVASNLNNPRPTCEQKGRYKVAEPTDAREPNATTEEQVQPRFAEGLMSKRVLAVRELISWHVPLPYAATLRGSLFGRKWACKVATILGRPLQEAMRAAIDNWLLDSENIAFLAAVHSCCFGREMIADYPEITEAAYMRGFLMGVLATWKDKNTDV